MQYYAVRSPNITTELLETVPSAPASASTVHIERADLHYNGDRSFSTDKRNPNRHAFLTLCTI